MQSGMKPQQITIKTAWGKLRAQSWGISKAVAAPKTVLALHGWLDNSNSLTPLLQLKNPPPDTRWICVDMAGHGKSDWRPRGLSYHFFDYLQDLADVCDQLKLEQLHLVGHSLGGGVAAFFAASFPEKVLSLTCLDSLGPLPYAPDELPSHFHEFREHWKMLMAGKKVMRPIKTISRAVAARRMAGQLEPASAELLVTRNLRRNQGGWQWATDPRLKLPTAYRVSEEQVRAFLKQIQCPTKIIAAEEGILNNEKFRQGRLACLRQPQIVSVPGGHHVHMDHPERVIPHLNLF
jgi:pimeloyl-ACP methyl ester carboxylesterase